MQENIYKNKVYIKKWGKHKDGFIKLIYNSGAYATYIKELNGEIIENKEIIIRCKDKDLNIVKYAKENGYMLVE